MNKDNVPCASQFPPVFPLSQRQIYCPNWRQDFPPEHVSSQDPPNKIKQIWATKETQTYQSILFQHIQVMYYTILRIRIAHISKNPANNL